MKRTTILIAILVTAAAAQTLANMDPGIGTAVKQNAEALRQYSYKRRTVISINGQSRGARVELIRYVDGRMEAVPLESPARPAAPGGAGRRRARMAEKKREEMKEEFEGLIGLLHRYLSFDSDSAYRALAKATISKTGPEPGAVKVVATGVVKPSDSLILTWSANNRRPERIEIRSELNGKPVSATVEYAALPDGPFYPAHTLVSVPKQDISITVDTYDYSHEGGAK
jgi:hypothetical protein